ncbi:MAG TPA: hypothetical protein VMW11_00500 [Candidatus Dormibacteraeota bacterium]|nr:hypothetical protein [Candidatus Dormibacteraeota bacterium]
MSPQNLRRMTMLAAVIALAACGGSGVASPSAAASTPSATGAAPSIPTATAAPRSCPTAATVGTALGITVPKPVGVAGGGGTQLPAGATGIVCEYPGQSLNVIIVVVTNIDPSLIAQFSSRFPVAYASLSGVGDQARSFSQSLGGGKDNEGMVATKGRTLVSITATATPASLAQIGALINRLL